MPKKRRGSNLSRKSSRSGRGLKNKDSSFAAASRIRRVATARALAARDTIADVVAREITTPARGRGRPRKPRSDLVRPRFNAKKDKKKKPRAARTLEF